MGTTAYIVMAVIVVFAWQGVVRVPQGYEHTLEWFGRYVRTDVRRRIRRSRRR